MVTIAYGFFPTWQHCTPGHLPTSHRIRATATVSAEQKVDNVALAYYGGRQTGAAGLLHQSRPVSVRDGQVIAGTIASCWA